MAGQRRGPGRPPNPWRPRKIIQDYIEVSEGYHSPETRRVTISALRKWEAYLRKVGVDSDLVLVQHYVDWVRDLQARGFRRGIRNHAGLVRGYYALKGSREPDSRWSKLAAELKVFRLPKIVGKKEPYKPYALQLLPKILEAARHVKHFTIGDERSRGHREIYSEAYTLTATFLYAGGRAQWYSLTDQQVREALERKYVELFVKKGEYVYVPIHDRLLEIWRQHLERRDFRGPMFFRHGRNPYTYQEGSKDWRNDNRSARSNNGRVQSLLKDVQFELKKRFGIDEVLTSHRFRKSLATYMEQYGFTSAERRLQLSHGAKDITEFYSAPAVVEVQRKLSRMDLGSAEWVAAHDPPANLFVGGNGDVSDDLLKSELASMRTTIDRLAKELADERARNRELTDKLLARLEVVA